MRVGTLDEPDRLPPDVHIFTASKQPWVVIPAGAPAFAEYYDSAQLWPAASLARRAALLARTAGQDRMNDHADRRLSRHPLLRIRDCCWAWCRRAKGGASSPADRGSTRVLWLVIMPSMFLAFQFEFGWRAAGWPPQPWINVVGIADDARGAGVALVRRSSTWGASSRSTSRSRRITSSSIPGRTGWLRHPSYTGALLAFLGLGLCTQNWASLALIVIGTTAAFCYRMHVEEVALTGAFGERYRQYMQRTWRLIPGVY